MPFRGIDEKFRTDGSKPRPKPRPSWEAPRRRDGTAGPRLTYELPRHEEEVEEGSERQPLLHLPLLGALPPAAAAAAGVRPAGPGAAQGDVPLQQGLVVGREPRGRPVHRRLRSRLRAVVRHHHAQLVKPGEVLIPHLVREVKGTGVVQEQRVLALP